MKLVSVVIPMCNDRKEYLKEAIESIRNQTYLQVEIIVVDSSDNHEAMRQFVEKIDAGIRYFYKEKNGVADALNYGIAQARGEYIARMDADDISVPTRLEKQVNYLEEHPEVSILGSSYQVINENGEVTETRYRVCSYQEIQARLLFDNPMCHPVVMFRRTLFDEGMKYQKVFAEDYDLWTRCAPCKKMANLPDCLLLYRKHATNLSKQGMEKVRSSGYKSTRTYMESLFEESFAEFEDKDFEKNHHFFYVEDTMDSALVEFVLRQIRLIKKIYEINQKKKILSVNLLEQELLERTRMVSALFTVISPKLKRILQGLEQKISVSLWDQLLEEVVRNEVLVKKELEQEKNFLLYGMGGRGEKTLAAFESNQESIRWKLLGVIDKKQKEYQYGGEKFYTERPERMETFSFDYIVISAKEYYNEIREELIKRGIPEEKIIRDALFFGRG